MRLIDLRLPDFRGAERGLSIPFALQQSEPDAASLAFLVGPNGSGKSRVLEALGQIFAHLASSVPPGFRFELEYELARGRVLLTTESERIERIALPVPARLQEIGGWLLLAERPFESWRREHLQEAWPTYREEVLPLRVFGLSSGPASRLDWALRESVASTLSQRLPGPAHADADELAARTRVEQQRSEEEMIRGQLQELAVEPRSLAIAGAELVLPIFALLSHPESGRGEDEIRDRVLRKAGLVAGESLRAISFDVPADWDGCLSGAQRDLFADFLDQVAHRVALAPREVGENGDPDPAGPDLRCVFVPDPKFEKWIEKNAKSPLVWLTHLQSWFKAGSLTMPRLLLTTQGREGLLRERDLSDGEFLVVGRYSLLLLLRGHEDCLVLFDEPETHFNDRWKIDLIYDLESALDSNTAQVVIATHSDLTLTDADRFSVFVIEDEQLDDADEVSATPRISPLGADRNEISQHIFGADGVSGRRSRAIVKAALESNDHESIERAIDRVGPGFQEFLLRYRAEQEKDDAP